MGIVRVLPDVEQWLDAEAQSWSPISDRDYVSLVRRWREAFLPLVAAGTHSFQGNRAMQAIAERFPADIWLIGGVQVPELANTGGLGAAGYQAVGLRNLRRELLNHLELVVVANDFSWSCVFSHEAGAWVWESLYERTSKAENIRRI